MLKVISGIHCDIQSWIMGYNCYIFSLRETAGMFTISSQLLISIFSFL